MLTEGVGMSGTVSLPFLLNFIKEIDSSYFTENCDSVTFYICKFSFNQHK